VVSFNYRVGPYGFLASEEVRKDGDLNVGLLDQRAALKWVSEHIQAFGGDPKKVTIAGTSIGGGSVFLNMVAYGGEETSLFRAGIAEASYLPSVYEVSDMEFQYDQLLHATGCESLACLRKLPVSKLQEVNIPRPFPGQTEAPNFGYNPVIDGEFLQARPMELLSQGKIVKKPILSGTSRTEGTFVAPQANTTADIDAYLRVQFPDLSTNSLRAVQKLYKSAPTTYPGVEVDEAPLFYRAAQEYGDAAFQCPTYQFSSLLHSSGVPVYTFLDHILDPAEVAAGLVVPHTWEVAAVWGPEYATQYVALPNATSYDKGGLNADMVPLIQAYWTSFIRTGDPNSHKLAEAPTWEQYGLGGGRVLKLQTNATEMRSLPTLQNQKCALWATLAGETHH
jgi:acetylcholinesterase